MTNSTTDRMVDHYLTRLAEAAQALSPEGREELLSEIREHITASMAGAAGTEEAAVRTMLDRLGKPADIVAAALEANPPAAPSHQGLSRGLAPRSAPLGRSRGASRWRSFLLLGATPG